MVERLNSNSGEHASIWPDLSAEVSEIASRLDVIDYFRPDPDSAKTQKELFLSGSIDQPTPFYPALEKTDFVSISNQISETNRTLQASNASEKTLKPYRDQLYRDARTIDLLTAANEYGSSGSPESRQAFMEANIELFGEPSRTAFEGLVSSLRNDLSAKNLTGRAEDVKNELLSLLPEVSGDVKSFKPTEETVEWAGSVVETLYEGFLEVVPDKKAFSSNELKDIFDSVLREVIGEEAGDWTVDISEKTSSIDVSPPNKNIKIPPNKNYSKERVNELLVHEIGVHVLRSVMGAGTDIDMLRTGMPNYTNAEEGTAVVFEQALNGRYEDRGVPYYLVAGLEYFADRDFRGAFEVMWRRNALDDLGADDKLSDKAIEKAKNRAYTQVFRINRGTNDLPWFKDLAYYNGNVKIWEYVEKNLGDPDAILNLFYGKVDPTNPDHMRAAWDASRVD